MVLQVYEMTNQAITGYKLYDEGVQVATLEQRSNQWIAGIFYNFKIICVNKSTNIFIISK